MCVCSSRRIQIRDNDIRAIHLMSKLTRAFLPSFSSLPQRGGITNQKPISDSSSSSSSSLLSYGAATNVSIWSLLFYLALSSVTLQHFYERNTSVLTCPLGRVINMATAAAIFSNSFFLFRNLSGVWPCGVRTKVPLQVVCSHFHPPSLPTNIQSSICFTHPHSAVVGAGNKSKSLIMAASSFVGDEEGTWHHSGKPQLPIRLSDPLPPPFLLPENLRDVFFFVASFGNKCSF